MSMSMMAMKILDLICMRYLKRSFRRLRISLRKNIISLRELHHSRRKVRGNKDGEGEAVRDKNRRRIIIVLSEIPDSIMLICVV